MKTVLPTKLHETKLNVYLITFEVTISSLLCFIRILITGIYSDRYFLYLNILMQIDIGLTFLLIFFKSLLPQHRIMKDSLFGT
jgi:hypothetical protein